MAIAFIAVIRGSAINQDGRSGGLTAPNGPAQEAVIRAALANAGVEARAVSYVETHGTGTPLGDPIEAGALGAVFKDQRDEPLLIGSVKTNLGHLEAAAGMAGLIKVVQSLRRQAIPANLHFHRGNPLIDWEALNLAVPTQALPWTPIAGRRIAGVSSFGFSGTNAHVLIEEAPQAPAPVVADTESAVAHLGAFRPRERERFAISPADTPTGWRTKPAVADVCFSANTGRSHFSHRLAVVGASAAEMREALLAFGDTQPHPGLGVGVRRRSQDARAWRSCSPAKGRNTSEWGERFMRHLRFSNRRWTSARPRLLPISIATCSTSCFRTRRSTKPAMRNRRSFHSRPRCRGFGAHGASSRSPRSVIV